MICVSVGRTRHKHTIAEYHYLAEQGADLVELRLDYIGRAVNLKRLLAKRPCPVVATVRRTEDGGRWSRSETDRQMLLRSAIAAGVEYVDIEEDIAEEIPRYGHTKRIVSYHNFQHTPEDLFRLHSTMEAKDADIVKIATMANSVDDNFRMFQLVQSVTVPTVGICMGELGMPTRILGNRFGAPFTYTSFSRDRTLAPGQLNWRQMRDLYRYSAITEKTQLYGVIADPVAHSHSPLIHNNGFIEDNLDACYLPFHVPASDLASFIENCPRMGIRGLSVTIPHKERAVNLCTQVEASANAIGAINTMIVTEDGKLLGYNTDYRAAMDCLAESLECDSEEEKPYTGKTALVLGAGGVSRAIAWGLLNRGATIVISARTRDRAENLAHDLGPDCSHVPWDDRDGIQCDLLINGTPVGMHPNVDESPFDDEKLRSEMVVFDTIYNPEQTLLIKQARNAGCVTITGVAMFVRQAIYQYKLFTGINPNPGLMHKAIKDATSPVRLNR